MPRLPTALVSCVLFACGACSDAELVGLHLRLAADGSGVLTTRSLVHPEEPGPAEARTQGVIWNERAALSFSQGSVQDVRNLRFGEIHCSGDPQSRERPGLRVFVPRGPEVAWVAALVPNADTRRKLAKVYDPTGKTPELASTIRLELQLPAEVIATGVQPTGRGIETDRERNRAWLSIPVHTALEKGDELVWDISWLVLR